MVGSRLIAVIQQRKANDIVQPLPAKTSRSPSAENNHW
jgi:hypothetical protein